MLNAEGQIPKVGLFENFQEELVSEGSVKR
jgi:hypothetical protein